MDPIAVDIRLIRAVLGIELRVAPGRALMARVVAADGQGRGSLSIAGALIDAKLPKGIQAGDELRLTVRDVTPERVVLSLSDQAAAAAAQTAAELPGGGHIRVSAPSDEEEAGARGGRTGAGRHTLALVYDAPALGAVELRFELDSQALRVNATLAAGQPAASAAGAAGELRDALATALARPVTVEVTPRREPLDLYA
jgi:hypothetical protein